MDKLLIVFGVMFSVFGCGVLEAKEEVAVYRVEILPEVDENGDKVAVVEDDRVKLLGELVKRLKTVNNLKFKTSILKSGQLEVETTGLPVEQHGDVLNLLAKSGYLSIHGVHPKGANSELAGKVLNGEEAILGYKLAIEKGDEANEDRLFLVKAQPALDSGDIEHAEPEKQALDNLFVRLTKQGGEKMEAFTRALDLGDLIVVLIDDEVVSAASLNAEFLGRNFVISGLRKHKEAELLSSIVMAPLSNRVKVEMIIKK